MMNPSDIQEHREVVGSRGKRLGIMDRVEGSTIKQTRGGSEGTGEHHFIPLN